MTADPRLLRVLPPSRFGQRVPTACRPRRRRCGLAHQVLPLLVRQAADGVEVGAGVLAAVVEEADVVVLLLEGLDLALDELVEVLVQELDQFRRRLKSTARRNGAGARPATGHVTPWTSHCLRTSSSSSTRSTTSSRREIKPLEQEDDNIRFLDHRREDARTDWDRGGLPNEEWEDLMREARKRADKAGIYRYSYPKRLGGMDGTNLGMAVIREHLAAKGLGLHCDLQTEHTIVGNILGVMLMEQYGSDEQKEYWLPRMTEHGGGFAFGITELNHGSDATWMETNAYRDGDEWVINGNKTWNTGLHNATHDVIFARTSGEPGEGTGITAFIVPTDTPGLRDRRVPVDVQHADRPRHDQADQRPGQQERRSSATRAAACRWCRASSTRTASARRRRRSAPRSSASTSRSSTPWSASRSARRWPSNQGIQFPLVELQTQCDMLRLLIQKTAWQLDTEGEFSASAEVSMCNYWANRLCCEAADRAMQVHGGLGYSRHKPFEHIYRHHRRYRITEGAEEIQMRRVAGYLFGFMGQKSPKGVDAPADRGNSRRLNTSPRPRGSKCSGSRFRTGMARGRWSAGDSIDARPRPGGGRGAVVGQDRRVVTVQQRRRDHVVGRRPVARDGDVPHDGDAQ